MELPNLIEENCVYASDYMHLHEKVLEKADGSRINWELIVRPPHGSSVQGVDMIAKILKDGEWNYVLQLEYRYPVQGYVLCFPGGTTEENENIADAAVRELKEETGYLVRPEDITPEDVGPLVHVDPWKSTEKSKHIQITINHELEENKEPIQELDTCEIITIVYAKANDLHNEILKIQAESQCAIDSRLYTYAIGLSIDI